MAKRRPWFDYLEQRLCMATLQTTITLPDGAWTPTEYRASPLFYDINHTGKDDLIEVGSGAQIIAYSENPNGSASPIIYYQVPPALADGYLGDIKSTPIIVTDPRTGQQDLFAAMGRDESKDDGGPPLLYEDDRVFGWNLKTGQFLPGFANGIHTGTDPSGYAGTYGALTSGFLQNNGIPDIVVTSYSHEVTAMTIDGTILWQWDNDDTIASGAVIADIGRDGTPEVVVGGDSSSSQYFQQGGWVNVISNTGQLVWRRQIPGEVTWSSPVVADLLNNGQLDIVIGTGDNFSYTLGTTAATDAGDYIYAFDPNGNMLPGWPYSTMVSGDTQGNEVLACPVVADLTGDGQLDVIALDRSGYIHVIQPNGQDLPGFVGGKRLDPDLLQSQLSDNYGSPIVADVTGNGVPDIIAASGPFIRAFDPQGNLIDIGQTPYASDGFVEGVDSAPAIGNFDGTGGLCMAVESYDADRSNIPDKVQIYQLPASTLTPPWPFLRRTVTGDAVMRSPVYDQQYVVQAFNTLLGSQPSAGTLQLYDNALNTDAINLLSTAQLIAISAPVQDAEITKIYEAFLGQAPTALDFSYWSSYLNNNSYRQMESLVASSAAFAQRAGGNYDVELNQLYAAILGRYPTPIEGSYLISAHLPMSTIANSLLNSSEYITDEFDVVAQRMFGPGSQSLLPPDSLATYSYDIHTGMTEAAINSNMLVSAANLASTSFVASYVNSLYRDILDRDGSASDIAYWVSQIDTGAVSISNLASIILNSTEAREDYVQDEFYALLGHGADAGTLASMANYTSRENVLIAIVGSPEYYAKNGGTNASFVAAAFRDLAVYGITPQQDSAIAAQLADGQTTTAGVASGIIYDEPSIYFANLVVDQLSQFIPIEADGVLRTGELPANAAGQPVNPSPSLINYFESLYAAGYSDEQVLSIIFNSPQYDSEVIFYRGLYRTPGVRY